MIFDDYHLIDLTHELDPSIPTWSGGCGFQSEIKMDYEEGLRVLKYSMHAGIGTHMDAPSHYIRDGLDISSIDLEQLLVECVVIDIRHKMHEDLRITAQDIKDFEREYRKIEPNTCVIGFTGWETFWKNPMKYRNPKPDGLMHFPGFSKECVEYLLERDISGIGIDTLSPDGSDNSIFPAHHLMLGAGKYILENLCNLSKLRPEGCLIINLPLKIRQGTESAVRSVGLVPKHG